MYGIQDVEDNVEAHQPSAGMSSFLHATSLAESLAFLIEDLGSPSHVTPFTIHVAVHRTGYF